MIDLKREAHHFVVEALGGLDSDLFLRCSCWFGGGTAIVLKLGEYRQSLDVDFLCSDADGYRELRSAAVATGIRAFFSAPVEAMRDLRIDQYGIRTVIGLRDHPIKFEIVREGRIALAGQMDQELNVPVLLPTDMFAEKLLANADRCQDRAVAYRDAIDLGVMIGAFEGIPADAVAKATTAYGTDVGQKVDWVVKRLSDRDELRQAAQALQMEPDQAFAAIDALARESSRIWPAYS